MNAKWIVRFATAFAFVSVLLSTHRVGLADDPVAIANRARSNRALGSEAHEDIYLHGDEYDPEDVEKSKYIDHLFERSEHQSSAWAAIRDANTHWRQSHFPEALNAWEKVASKYWDTDVAYAALSNIALGRKQIGDAGAGVEALQALLLLPVPTQRDFGMEYRNYRHNACVSLADYYESKGLNAMACVFLKRALREDELHEMCGTYAYSKISELTQRFAKLEPDDAAARAEDSK